MRHIYIDESGTSSRELVAVVAGVIIDVDKDYRGVVSSIERVKRHHLGDNYDRWFHAADIFAATGDFEKLSGWTRQERVIFIRDMIEVCNFHAIPVAVSWMHKDATVGIPTKNRNTYRHWSAFCACFVVVDKYIANNFPNEHASIKAESCDHMKKYLDFALADVRRISPKPDSWIYQRQITNIVDDIQFLRKGQAPLLQLADAYSWGFRAYMTAHPHTDELYPALFASKDSPIPDRRSELIGTSILIPIFVPNPDASQLAT
ncbi:DUF3800 domain-containing protein [Mesorhizobium sp. M1273]|uniref:DUF3800 domain-containing protein n=1 Tax=Mesorhizobium sp. M1273 TaxID=2957075 RepID=UPI00333C38A5